MPDVFTITKKDGSTYTLNWSFRALRYDLGGRDRTQVLRREGRATFKHRGDKANTPEPYVLEGTLWTDARTTAGYNALRSEAKDIRDAVRSARSLRRVNKAGRWVFDDIIGGPKPVFTQASRFEIECTIELWPVVERDAEFTAAADITDFTSRPYPGTRPSGGDPGDAPTGDASGPEHPDAPCEDGVTDPNNVTILTSVTDARLDGAWDVFVLGNYAYVASLIDDRLVILDVSTPSSPTITGSVQDATNLANAVAVFVLGDFAYVAAAGLGANRMTIVDVSDKTNPTVVGSVQNSSLENAIDVHVIGDYAYVVASLAHALTIVDVSNKASPSVSGSVSDPIVGGSGRLDGARGIVVNGDYAYVVAENSDTLTIVNVSNKSSPSIVGSVSDSGDLNRPRNLYVLGDYAYVTAFDGDALTVVDVSSTSSPTVSGSVTDATQLNQAHGVHAADGVAYVVTAETAGRLTMVDVSSPATPSILSTTTGSALNDCRGVFVKCEYVYVASKDNDRFVVLS